MNIRKTDMSDYDAEKEEVEKIWNSNKNTVDLVANFFPTFSAELNETKSTIASERDRILAIEQQQKTHLLAKLQHGLSMLLEKLHQQEFVSNYSLDTVKDSLQASLTELASAQKEISNEQTFEKVESKTKLYDGLQNASEDMNKKIGLALADEERRFQDSEGSELAKVRKATDMLYSYEKSINKSLDELQNDLDSTYPSAVKHISMLNLKAESVRSSVDEESQNFEKEVSSLKNLLNTSENKLQSSRISQIAVIQKTINDRTSSVFKTNQVNLASQKMNEEKELGDQISKWKQILLSLHSLIISWDSNATSNVKSIESKLKMEKLGNADNAKDILHSVSIAENTSAARLLSFESKIENMYRKISSEQHNGLLQLQNDKEGLQDDIDAKFQQQMLNMTNLLHDQKQTLLKSVDQKASQTSQYIQNLDSTLQDMNAHFSAEIEKLRIKQNDFISQEARNVTLESRVLDLLKSSLLRKVSDLEQDASRFLTTSAEDRSSVQKQIDVIKSKLSAISNEMSAEEQMQSELSGIKENMQNLKDRETYDNSVSQQSSRDMAAEVAHIRSVLNFTTQDIDTTITEEERKGSILAFDVNHSVAILRANLDYLRSAVASVSKMAGPQGPPGVQGAIGMKVNSK